MDQPATFDAWDFERSPHTVILDREGTVDDDWLASVRTEERGRRVIVVKLTATPWVDVVGADVELPTLEDLGAASAVLVDRGLAKPGDRVDSWSTTDKELPPPLEGLGQKRRLFSVGGLEQHVKDTNENTARDLVDQLRSPLAVMPFVGAGMSAPFGYPLWEVFLREAAAEFDLTHEVGALLDNGEFERAAEALDKHDASAFAEKVRTTFRRRDPPPDLTTGAISYLPLLTSGPVISTNFDPIVKDAFEAAGLRLKDIIDGPREQPIVRAVHHNERTLLMIHGTAGDRTFRVLTLEEYERGYTSGDVTLSSLALLIFTNRPLLILGSSLDKDRNVDVLENIHDRLAGLWHYAILEASYSESRLAKRRAKIAKLGIRPLWYPAGHHDKIAEMLRDVVERAATDEIHSGSGEPGPAPREDTGLRAIADLPPDVEPYEDTAAIARALCSGGLTPFLGAYAHLGRLPLGNEFYAELAEEFGVPETEFTSDRASIAGYIAANRPPHVLWKAVRSKLEGATPTVVHAFVAALPAFLRSRGSQAPTWIFTTNYDVALEQALAAAEEPFHVLYYQESDGRFVHTAPDGTMRVINRPDAIRDLTPGSVVVKLNGGLAHAPGPVESAVMASSQFERLAGQLPDALPACARAVLRERSLLFLGQGLAEPDVNKLVDYTARPADKPRSWAVRPQPHDSARFYRWQERTRELEDLGVTTVDADLERFLSDLRRALLTM